MLIVKTSKKLNPTPNFCLFQFLILLVSVRAVPVIAGTIAELPEWFYCNYNSSC